MWGRSLFTCLGVIFGLGCAPPEAAFEGRYVGTQTCAGRNVDTGELLSDGPNPIDIVIELDAETGEAFIAGRCIIPLDVRSAAVASVVPVTCNAAGEDGTPYTITYESGAVALDGDELAVDYSVLGVSPAETLTVNYRITAWRD
jgi:hypothetical protein